MPPRAVASPTSPPRELRPGFEAQTRKPATASSVRPTHPPHGHVSRQPSRLAPATRSTPPVFSRRCRSESTTAGRPSSSVPRPKPHVRPSPHSAHQPGTSSLAFTTPSSTVSCNSCTPQADRHGCTRGFRHRVNQALSLTVVKLTIAHHTNRTTRVHVNLVFAISPLMSALSTPTHNQFEPKEKKKKEKERTQSNDQKPMKSRKPGHLK